MIGDRNSVQGLGHMNKMNVETIYTGYATTHINILLGKI